MKHFIFSRASLITAAILMPAAATSGQVEYQDPNTDHEICPEFYKIIEDVNISKLSDRDLCDFRFSSQGLGHSREFSSPKWVVVGVKDPVAMYEKMVDADHPVYSPKKRGVDTKETLNKIKSYFYSGDIEFVKSSIPMITYDQGSKRTPVGSLTLLEMRYRRCPIGDRTGLPVPYFAAFEDADMKVPLMSNGMSIANEIVIWRGWVPIALYYPDRWLPGDKNSMQVYVGIDSVWRSSMRRGGWEIEGGTICSYAINRQRDQALLSKPSN